MKRKTPDKQLTDEERAWVRGAWLLSGLVNPFVNEKAERAAFKTYGRPGLSRFDNLKPGQGHGLSRKFLAYKNGTKTFYLERTNAKNQG